MPYDAGDVPEIKLPIINLSEEVLNTDPERRKTEIKKLFDSFTEVGFCLINGIKDYNSEQVFKWTKWFYYDVEEKDR